MFVHFAHPECEWTRQLLPHRWSRENWKQTIPLRQSLERRYSPVVLVVLSLRSPVSTVVDRSAGTIAIENMRTGHDVTNLLAASASKLAGDHEGSPYIQAGWLGGTYRFSIQRVFKRTLQDISGLRARIILDPRCKRFSQLARYVAPLSPTPTP